MEFKNCSNGNKGYNRCEEVNYKNGKKGWIGYKENYNRDLSGKESVTIVADVHVEKENNYIYLPRDNL